MGYATPIRAFISILQKRRNMTPYNDLNELLLSNDEPSEYEAALVYLQIQEIDNALHVVDCEIAPETSASRHWTRVKDALRQRRREYNAILLPIRRVPLEIWSEIFGYDALDVFDISKVCRTWRNLALSTPKLWTGVAIDIFDEDFTSEAAVAFIKEWLRRSHNLGISVCLFYDTPTGDITRLEQIIKSIPDKNRWKNAYMGPRCVHPLFNGNESSWDMLEEVIIDVSPYFLDPLTYRSDLEMLSVVDLSHLHCLKRLTLNVREALTEKFFLAPWSQLTYMHLNMLAGMRSYLKILRHCINLEECILALDFTSDTDAHEPLTQNRILLPKLATLFLTSGDDITLFLNHIQLPSLKHLYLSNIRSVEPAAPYRHSPSIDITDMVEASACVLLCLELHTVSMRAEETKALFQSLKTLKQLRITNTGYIPPLNDPFIKEMAKDTFVPEKTLLPQLNSLEVSSNVDVLSFRALQDLIVARTSHAPDHVTRIENAVWNHQNAFAFSSSSISSVLSPFTAFLRENFDDTLVMNYL